MFVIRQQFVGILSDMNQGIVAHQITRSENCAARPRSRRAPDGIDLLDGHPQFGHVMHGVKHGKHADPVTDEVRRILAKDDSLAEADTTEFSHGGEHRGIGFRTWNELQETHVARRVEEMGDQEILPHRHRQEFGHRIYRQAAGIGGKDGAIGKVRHHLLGEQTLLDGHILNHHLDHPVAFPEPLDIVLQIPDLDLTEIVLVIESFILQDSLHAIGRKTIADGLVLQ